MNTVVLRCKTCESTQFDEMRGKKYCIYCQTELEGYTTQLLNTSFTSFTREIRTKISRNQIRSEQKIDSWTKTQAFNKILTKQIECISQIEGIGISLTDLKTLTQNVWFTYLDMSGLAMKPIQTQQSYETHPATSVRDKTFIEYQFSQNCQPIEGSDNEQSFDSNYPINRYTGEMVSPLDLAFSVEKTQNMLNALETNVDLGQRSSHMSLISCQENIDLSECGSHMSLISCQQDMSEEHSSQSESGQSEEIDEKMMEKLSQSEKIALKEFTDAMSLPKTLAIINIAIRFYKDCNIQVSDLIRWSIERHIPYINSIECLPNQWNIKVEDYKIFNQSCCPSGNTINKMSAQIAKRLEIESFPHFQFNSLITRYAEDLKLPKDIVLIIDKYYNLNENFSKKFRINIEKSCFPHFDRWALMAIVMVIKRMLVLDDSYEKDLSESAKKCKQIPNLFIWDEWRTYTKLRLEVIKSYFIPFYRQNIEDIRDTQLLSSHYSTRSQLEVDVDTRPIFQDKQLRENLHHKFHKLSESYENSTDESVSTLYPSMFGLCNATNFALNRLNYKETNTHNKLKSFEKSLEKKILSPYVSDGKSFHRPYKPLNIGNATKPCNIEKWSKSFCLLIEMSCIVLNCDQTDLYVILNQFENKFFKNEKSVIPCCDE